MFPDTNRDSRNIRANSSNIGWSSWIQILSVVSETTVGERVWNGGAALVGLMYFGGECCLTPKWTVEGRKSSLVVFAGGKRGIVLDQRKLDFLGEKVTTGRGPVKLINILHCLIKVESMIESTTDSNEFQPKDGTVITLSYADFKVSEHFENDQIR
ncbi:hypothetical protein TNCV_3460381 [Trichonephila clavipes]|nr:hypothetical protein TNCV_3460381 [Trichonephila clavipes]